MSRSTWTPPMPLPPSPAPAVTEALRIARMLNDGEAQARDAINEACWLIWNSIRKFNGDPCDTLGHPLACGCTYCN